MRRYYGNPVAPKCWTPQPAFDIARKGRRSAPGFDCEPKPMIPALTRSQKARRARDVPGNQSAVRLLTVLAAFAENPAQRSVTDLSRALGFGKTLTHRALTSLVKVDYLVRDRGGSRYELGWRSIALDGWEDDSFDLRALCRPYLEKLHGLSNESVFLSIIVGLSRVNIDDISARGRRVSYFARGRPVPLHDNQMSRMLLAYLGEHATERYLALAGRAAEADGLKLDADAVRRELSQIRRDGYIVWTSPKYEAAYITVPLLDGRARLHAVLTVGGPLERFPTEVAAKLRAEIEAVIVPLRERLRLFPAPSVPFPAEPFRGVDPAL
jgi:DNA-binding IclR family transcriptional regulator